VEGKGGEEVLKRYVFVSSKAVIRISHVDLINPTQRYLGNYAELMLPLLKQSSIKKC